MTRPGAAPFLAWPGKTHLLYAATLGLVNGLWFVLVFVLCDYMTHQRMYRVPIHTALDLTIPFVPSMTAVYMSLYALLIAGPFVLRTRREFRAAVAMLALIISIAGIGFRFIPADLAYPPVTETELGRWATLYHIADALNLTYNLVPSLHVALTVGCVAAFSTRTGALGKVLLWCWAAAIALSTLLTHQHHILDVVTGWLLALLCYVFVYVPLARPGVSLGVSGSRGPGA